LASKGNDIVGTSVASVYGSLAGLYPIDNKGVIDGAVARISLGI
jgi:hypothetical protein